jgi:hypothetical protein
MGNNNADREGEMENNSVNENQNTGIQSSESQATPELSADQWLAITDISPTEGQIVETKIDDANGSRNVALLVRRGNLWYFADESMYVYYSPTHYRKPLVTDVEKELSRLSTKAGAFEEIKKRLAATETRAALNE